MGGVLLVAASGLAREALAVERAVARYPMIRVIDDNPRLWGSSLNGAPIVGGVEEVKRYDGSEIVVCAGHGAARRSIVRRLAELGVTDDRYTQVIHPSVDVPPGCTVGIGSILLARVVLTADVTVGRHVVVMPNVTLTHDDTVEDFATLCAGVTLGGEVRVGAGAYLGMNSSIRERLTVGRDATLGMGAALLRDLPPAQTWAGVPARPAGGHDSRKVQGHEGPTG
jgi:sugar O-acyltransferase (sialic acid O-acetyltransferase NeuD family)